MRGLETSALKDQTIVVAGAGSAGSGVLLTIRSALHRRHGLSLEAANRRFYIVDDRGCISKVIMTYFYHNAIFYTNSSPSKS